MYSPEEQESVRRSLSESLLGVIAQGLIKTKDGKRAAYHDILINTDACKDYIQRGALDEVEEIMERSGFDGMVTTNQSLLALVEADWLTDTFQQDGPFWSRHYRFFRQGAALTVIREVFSPQLETWLGPTLRQELQQSS